ALQAGREIRVIVKPKEVDDDQAVLLSHEIAREIEDQLEYPGQIKVTVIRESRAVEVAKNTTEAGSTDRNGERGRLPKQALAQRERLFELYPYVDVAFGPGSIAHLGDWVGAGGFGVERGSFGLDERGFAGNLPMHRKRRFQAWVQISMGCNSKCAYCIVPSVR